MYIYGCAEQEPASKKTLALFCVLLRLPTLSGIYFIPGELHMTTCIKEGVNLLILYIVNSINHMKFSQSAGTWLLAMMFKCSIQARVLSPSSPVTILNSLKSYASFVTKERTLLSFQKEHCVSSMERNLLAP